MFGFLLSSEKKNSFAAKIAEDFVALVGAGIADLKGASVCIGRHHQDIEIRRKQQQ